MKFPEKHPIEEALEYLEKLVKEESKSKKKKA